MTNEKTTDWYEINQRYLIACLNQVREALRRHAGRKQDTGETAITEEKEKPLDQESFDLCATSALDTVCEAFRLSRFERGILLLCAGAELDSSFLRFGSDAAQQIAFPTFSLALAALPGAHWSAVTPEGPLRRWHLIEVSPGESFTRCLIRIDERLLHYLTGISYLDPRLRSFIRPVQESLDLPASYVSLVNRICAYTSDPTKERDGIVVNLCGSPKAAMSELAEAVCAQLSIRLFEMRAGDIPQSSNEQQMLANLWEREAMLMHGALLIDCEAFDSNANVISFVRNLHGLIFVAGRDPIDLRNQFNLCLVVHDPDHEDQRQAWEKILGSRMVQMNGHLERILSQFSLSLQGIRKAGRAFAANCSGEKVDSFAPALWDACQIQARPRLEELAQRIEPRSEWNDLILPETQMQTLCEIGNQVRQRMKVYQDWGFASKSARGLGISVLFHGATGTGKTMAAEVLAKHLQLDFYRIDLSQVIDKYVGETEKRLRRVFDAAEEGSAVLLFDEADALFGKRSEVKDSHDRYANVEISYLLQRMEAYRGLAILTTNMKSHLDPAFLRRIRFVVAFPFPDATERERIWTRIFPLQLPTEDLDLSKLSQLNVSGGSIRNIAMNAAFLAAAAGERVRMTHVLRAARSEYSKLEKPLTDIETRGWI